MQEGNTHVTESTVEREDTDVQFAARDPRHTQQFRDTKYRRVAYTAVATTRFREYFPPSITDDPAKITRTGADGALQPPDAANPVLPPPVNASHPLPLGVVDVPSTARPQTPKLLYVVPTFGHELQAGRDGSMTSIRSGGGLRIYLERPWYSSGDGELLGVVLAPEYNGFIQATRRVLRPTLKAPDASHLTQWGLSPAQVSRGLPAPYAPKLDQFTAAELSANGISIDEQPGTAVVVAGHQVAYDADRRLWYCDITLDPGEAYYPFVRLALARCQPNSVGDAELSRVVLADFMQLAPDRTASIVIDEAAAPGCDRPRAAAGHQRADGRRGAADRWRRRRSGGLGPAAECANHAFAAHHDPAIFEGHLNRHAAAAATRRATSAAPAGAARVRGLRGRLVQQDPNSHLGQAAAGLRRCGRHPAARMNLAPPTTYLEVS